MEALTLQTEEIMIWDKEEDQIDGVRIKTKQNKKKTPQSQDLAMRGGRGRGQNMLFWEPKQARPQTGGQVVQLHT